MRRFRLLNLVDLRLGLDDLLQKRHAALISSNIGQSYAPMLEEQRSSIVALPALLVGGRPLAESLEATDDAYDGFGGAIWHLTEAYLNLPAPNAQILDAIKRVRTALIPERAELRDSYADEADAAIRRKGELQQIENDLKSIPVAMGGSTLYDWALSYLGAGEKLATLLSDRVDATPAARKGAQKLRTETIALLNRARAAMADEIRSSNTVPKDLDMQVWGYFEELEGLRAGALGKKQDEPAAP